MSPVAQVPFVFWRTARKIDLVSPAEQVPLVFWRTARKIDLVSPAEQVHLVFWRMAQKIDRRLQISLSQDYRGLVMMP
jgi:hypothetical protein